MIQLNLERILKIKGITKPNLYLAKKGHSATYVSHLVTNKVTSVKFYKLEQLCIDFNCTPNDLFDYVPEKNHNLAADHALHSISKSEAIGEVSKLLHELPMEKIEELYAILKRKE